MLIKSVLSLGSGLLLQLLTISVSTSPGTELKSIKAIAYGDGHLFIADDKAFKVFAIDIRKCHLPATHSESYGNAPDIEGQLEKVLGADAGAVGVLDMCIAKAGVIFLAVRYYVQGLESYSLVYLNEENKPVRFSVTNTAYSSYELTDLPSADQEFYLGKSQTFTISDIDYEQGTLYIAGLSNLEFSSTLRRLKFPFKAQHQATALRIFHTAHKQFETQAPIYSLELIREKTGNYLVGGYLCSPLIVVPEDDLVHGDKLNAKTVAELGQSNIIIEIAHFQWKGKDFVAVVNTNRGVAVFEWEKLKIRPALSREEGHFTNTEAFHSLPLAGALRLEELDTGRLLVLKRDVRSGKLDLKTFKKSWM